MSTKTLKLNKSSIIKKLASEEVSDWWKLTNLADLIESGASFNDEERKEIRGYLIDARNELSEATHTREDGYRNAAYLLTKYDLPEAMARTTNRLYGKYIVEIIRESEKIAC